MQCSAAQRSAVQCSAVQCSAVQSRSRSLLTSRHAILLPTTIYNSNERLVLHRFRMCFCVYVHLPFARSCTTYLQIPRCTWLQVMVARR